MSFLILGYICTLLQRVVDALIIHNESLYFKKFFLLLACVM